MKIKAIVKRIDRVKVKAPQDGAHMVGKDGQIKGVHSVWFGDKLVPKGMTAFYWQLNEKKGIKIFFSLNKLTCGTLKCVKYIQKKQMKIYKLGFCPKPYGIKEVKLRLTIDGKKIKETAYGLVMGNVHVPKAWEEFAKGQVYDFTCNNHKEHCAAGYLQFIKKAKAKLKKHGIQIFGSFKLGDIMFCEKKERWQLVDID